MYHLAAAKHGYNLGPVIWNPIGNLVGDQWNSLSKTNNLLTHCYRLYRMVGELI
jgi:hypothetical protein